MGGRALLVHWNGKEMVAELRDLPEGCKGEPIDDLDFTEDEERGVEYALEQYRRGQTFTAAQARAIFDSVLKR